MDFPKLKAYINQLEAVYGVPHCDISIYQNHQEIFRESAGYTDLDRRRKPSDEDLYWLYSASKISLAVMIMQLVERGKLKLSDPVSKYIPEMGALKVKVGDELIPCKNQATIENYLAMQGGLDYDVQREDVLSYVREHPDASTREIVNVWLTKPLRFEPGTRYIYSMCHDVLGAVIEVVTGKSLNEHIHEAIRDPLGMQDLDYGVLDEKKHRMVQQYEYDPLTVGIIEKSEINPVSPVENKFVFGKNYSSCGAGLITRVSDYILLADALACDGVGANGNRILTRESIDMMRTSRIDTPIKKRDFRKGLDFGYEYGLGVRTLVFPETSKSPVGEFGWDGYAGVFFLSDVENHLSILYAMSVGAMPELKWIHHKLRDLMYEGIPL